MKKWIIIIGLVLFASISNGAIYQFQRALQALYVSFDNATNGFTSIEVQSAIEEAKTTAEGKARFVIALGFDGNGSTGRWLELATNVPSDISGYIFPVDSYIKEFSGVCASSTTVVFGVYKNAVQIDTLTLSSVRKATKTVTLTATSLDELSVKINSGSCVRPMVFIHSRYQ